MCCQICSEWEKGSMSNKEALNNIGEMIASADSEEEVRHLFELSNKIVDKEMPFQEWDSDEYTGVLDELDYNLDLDED